MKLNLSVEIDWISEDGNLDYEVESKIIKSIESTLISKIEKSLTEKISKGILTREEEISKKLDEKIMQTYDDFLSKEFEVTDKWGDSAGKTSVKEILKNKLEKFMTQKVDDYGKESDYGKHRYEKILNGEAQKQIDTFINNITKVVVDGIKKDINTEAQNRISKAILSDYSLKDLIR